MPVITNIEDLRVLAQKRVLVADTLETQWNERLRVLTQAKEEYEKQRQADSAQISAEQRTKIMELASDFPKLWNDPRTLDRDRKRMARLLLEDVTLRREQEVLVHEGNPELLRRDRPQNGVDGGHREAPANLNVEAATTGSNCQQAAVA